MKLNQLTKNLNLRIQGPKSQIIKGIMIHSKKVYPGCLYIACKGKKFDGHNFIHEALANGACAVVLQNPIPWLGKDITQLIHPDPHSLISTLASRFYQNPSLELNVIAITGTNGKTTCCCFIQQIAKLLGVKFARIGTLGYDTTKQLYDSELTTPDNIELQRLMRESVKNGADGLVLEATSQALDQARLDNIAFDYAIFTNLSDDHLDYHQTREHYLQSKAKLFELLEQSSKKKKAAFAYAEDPDYVKVTQSFKGQLTRYGIRQGELNLSSLEYQNGQLHFKIHYKNESIFVKTKLIGMHNALNILAAISPFLYEGKSLSELKPAIELLKSPPGRLQEVGKTPNGPIFVDFAHTPDALDKTLKTIKDAFPEMKISLVFGCGGDRDPTKRATMGSIAQKLADKIIITNDNPRHEDPGKIAKEILAGCKKQEGLEVILDRKTAIAQAIATQESCQVIVIAGKGHESYQITGDRKIRFNDAEICQEIMEKYPRSVFSP